jgi:hypothetical protein
MRTIRTKIQSRIKTETGVVPKMRLASAIAISQQKRKGGIDKSEMSNGFDLDLFRGNVPPLGVHVGATPKLGIGSRADEPGRQAVAREGPLSTDCVEKSVPANLDQRLSRHCRRSFSEGGHHGEELPL